MFPVVISAAIGASPSIDTYESCGELRREASAWREGIAAETLGSLLSIAVPTVGSELPSEETAGGMPSPGRPSLTARRASAELAPTRAIADQLWTVVGADLGIVDPMSARRLDVPGRAIGVLGEPEVPIVLSEVRGKEARAHGLRGSSVVWQRTNAGASSVNVVEHGGVPGRFVAARAHGELLMLATRIDLRTSLSEVRLEAMDCSRVVRNDVSPDDLVLNALWLVREGEVTSAGIVGRIDDLHLSNDHVWVRQRIGSTERITDFAIGATLEPRGSFEVDLQVLEMSEYQGRLRLAGTWPGGHSGFAVYATATLEPVYTVEDLAPGELLTEAVFDAGRGYLYTWLEPEPVSETEPDWAWRQRGKDPLFVVDLEPDTGRLLGALDIPQRHEAARIFEGDQVLAAALEADEDAILSWFDVSDPEAPRLVAQAPLEGGMNRATGAPERWSWFPESRTWVIPAGRHLARREWVALRMTEGTLQEVGRWPDPGGEVVWMHGDTLIAATPGGLVRSEGRGWSDELDWTPAELNSSRP